jgi:hypothetical protein
MLQILIFRFTSANLGKFKESLLSPSSFAYGSVYGMLVFICACLFKGDDAASCPAPARSFPICLPALISYGRTPPECDLSHLFHFSYLSSLPQPPSTTPSSARIISNDGQCYPAKSRQRDFLPARIHWNRIERNENTERKGEGELTPQLLQLHPLEQELPAQQVQSRQGFISGEGRLGEGGVVESG